MSLLRSTVTSLGISAALAALIVTFHLAPISVVDVQQNELAPVTRFSAPSLVGAPSVQKLPASQTAKKGESSAAKQLPDSVSGVVAADAATKELSVEYVEAEQFLSAQLQSGSWTNYDQDTFFDLALNAHGDEQARLFALFEKALHHGELDGLGLYANEGQR